MPFTGLVMQPHELAAVKDIFDEITNERWFDKVDGNEGALAAFLLRTYREGVTDPERLRTYCREVARFRRMKVQWQVTTGKLANEALENICCDRPLRFGSGVGLPLCAARNRIQKTLERS